MIQRRNTVGLSLLCALAFCAFAAQSASAAVPAINTTIYTCVKDAPTNHFKDAHCDEKTGASPKYGHVELEVGTKTKLTVTNKTTGEATEPSTLTGIVAGVALEITCATSHGKGLVENTLIEPGKKHAWDGAIDKTNSKCTVNKPANCTVKAIEFNSLVLEGVENLGPKENEMGVEYRPAEGKVLSTFTLENKGEEKCLLAGKPLNLEGKMIATTNTKSQSESHAGATHFFGPEMTSETLTLAGGKASFSALTTLEMEEVDGKAQNPISLTTTT